MINYTGKTYKSRDLAFIIPTKDRPKKIKNVLESIAKQAVRCGRIIIIDGGRSVKERVMAFSGILPVEYYECSPPGQLRQKKMGISLLDERTPLVGFLDDDIVLEPQALESMIRFWNECKPETAGVSFNIINAPSQRSSFLGNLFGLSTPGPGRVLRSGMTTSNCHVSHNVRTQWLCGGATVWRQQTLKEFPYQGISSRWAIAEDVVYSYPIGKKFPLYVCANAKVRHEHEMDYVSKMQHRFHGRTQTLWMFYFVESNKDLSRIFFLWTLLARIIAKCTIGIFTLQFKHFEFALGQIEGGIKGLSVLFRGESIATILSKETNAN